jgi:Na+-driven multidrug efflux pump
LKYFYQGFIGPIELGAQTIAQQMVVFCYMVPYGIGTAGCIRIGQFLGSNQSEEARNAYKVTITICGNLNRIRKGAIFMIFCLFSSIFYCCNYGNYNCISYIITMGVYK